MVIMMSQSTIENKTGQKAERGMVYGELLETLNNVAYVAPSYLSESPIVELS